MKLVFTLVSKEKKVHSVEIEVPNETEAIIKWGKVMTLGLYLAEKKKFYAPWSIESGEIVSE